MLSGDSDVTLRLARGGEAEDPARLSHQRGVPMTPKAARAGLRETPGPPDQALVVAESRGRVAGFVELRRVRLFMARRRLEVAALVVYEDSRGRGIGSRLLEEAERWAHDLRCSKMR